MGEKNANNKSLPAKKKNVALYIKVCPPDHEYSMSTRRFVKRRRRNNNRRRRNTKLSLYTRKSSRSQAQQIWKNQSQITSLQRRMMQTYSTNYYTMSGQNRDVVYPGYVFPLIDPGSLFPIFNSQVGGPNSYASHAQMNWIDFRGMVQVEAGDAVVSVDIFLMRMRPEVAEQVKADLGPLLNQITQVNTLPPFDGTYNNKFYHNKGSADLEGRQFTMMNPRAFEILQKRSFLVGDQPFTSISADAQEVTNIENANKPFHMRIPYRLKLDNPVGSLPGGTTQSWKTMAASEVPSHKQLFCFVSCNAVEGTKLFVDWTTVQSINEPN